MPITQATMIELMNESRAAIQGNKELRHTLLQYLASAKDRYSTNRDLVEVIVSTMAIINMHPYPDDRVTFKNEWHYKRVGGANNTNRERQRTARRMAGVLTQEESMERLALLNAARRSGGMPSQTYKEFNQEVEPKITRQKKDIQIKMPREFDEDKPLEFETLDDMPKPEGTFADQPAIAFDEPKDPYEE